MISFLYVTSLINNPKALNAASPVMMVVLATLTFFTFAQLEIEITPTNAALFSAYVTPGFLVLLFIIFYLLLVLFIVVKLVESFKGALVQKL